MLPRVGMLIILFDILSPRLRQSLGCILFAVFVQSVISRSGQANMLGEILIIEIDISKYFAKFS